MVKHSLRTEIGENVRPFMSSHLIFHINELYKNALKCGKEDSCAETFEALHDAAVKIAKRANEELQVDKPNKKTTFIERLMTIQANAMTSRKFLTASRTVYNEIMRILCKVRVKPENVKIQRITDPNQAAELLQQTMCVLRDSGCAEGAQCSQMGISIKAGCGAGGEVFFTKTCTIDGKEVDETYVFAGVLSDLLCAYTNKYIVGATAKQMEKDPSAVPITIEQAAENLQTLHNFFAIHPLAGDFGLDDNEA